MKTKNETSSARTLYGNPLFRKALHSAPVSRLLAAALGPRRCGRLIGRLLRPYVRPDAMNVLSVGRELFAKDTGQIAARTDIHFIPWRSGHLARLICGWVPKPCQTQTLFIPEERYRRHPGWDKGVELLKGLFAELERGGRVPVAMSANVDYWQEEPLRRFCAETGVKHLVLSRENHVVKEYQDIVRRDYAKSGFTFGGHVAVFSEHMKNLLVETRACRPDQVTVTGAPRMDVWLDERPAPVKDTVMLLPFRTCLIPGMFDDALEAFIETARAHPQLQFAVKCKEGRGDYDRMRKKFADCHAPANLRPEQHTDMRSLMERSRVIIGFNTLSLAEALLTDACVIIPSWKVTADNKNLTMMDPDDPELQKEIRFPRSAEAFREQLEHALRGPSACDRALRLRLTNRYMHFIPGETASGRIARLIHQLAGA